MASSHSGGGLKQYEVGVGSFLDQQVRAYMRNKDMSELGSLNEPCYPLRAPTMIYLDRQLYMVLTKTVSTSKKTSLCFVHISTMANGPSHKASPNSLKLSLNDKVFV